MRSGVELSLRLDDIESLSVTGRHRKRIAESACAGKGIGCERGPVRQREQDVGRSEHIINPAGLPVRAGYNDIVSRCQADAGDGCALSREWSGRDAQLNGCVSGI